MEYIIVGHSGTPSNADIGFIEIDRMDREADKLSCGWHYIIRLDGTMENGRDVRKNGSHTPGYNKNSIGICLVGDGTNSEPDNFLGYTKAQEDRLRGLLDSLTAHYPDALLRGQQDLIPTMKSPTFNLLDWYDYF